MADWHVTVLGRKGAQIAQSVGLRVHPRTWVCTDCKRDQHGNQSAQARWILLLTRGLPRSTLSELSNTGACGHKDSKVGGEAYEMFSSGRSKFGIESHAVT